MLDEKCALEKLFIAEQGMLLSIHLCLSKKEVMT